MKTRGNSGGLVLAAFLARLFLKRLWAAAKTSPVIVIAAIGLALILGIVLPANGIYLRRALSFPVFAVVLGGLSLAGAAGAWSKAPSLREAVFRHANSRYSNAEIRRFFMVLRSLGAVIPVVVAMLLVLGGVLVIRPDGAAALGLGALVLDFALCMAAQTLRLRLLREPRRLAGLRPVHRTKPHPRPLLHRLAAEFLAPDTLIQAGVFFAASLYLIFDMFSRRTEPGPGGPVEGLENYAAVMLVLGSLPCTGAFDAVARLNWKFRAIFGGGYGGYCRDGLLVYGGLSLPLVLPFIIISLPEMPRKALLIPAFIAVNLLVTINWALLFLNPLFKGLIWMGYLVFSAAIFRLNLALAPVLLLIAGILFLMAPSHFRDRGSYDYMR